MTNIQRPGIDHDPIKPWVWGTLAGRSDPVEVVSYPIPAEGSGATMDAGATIMVRMMPGDPTSIREAPLRAVACFEADRHEWFYRPKRYYGDTDRAFHFTDAIEAAKV